MRGKILVADDSEAMRTTLVALFRMARPEAEVLEASDGHAAVSLAIEHEPDVIVLDGEMPCSRPPSVYGRRTKQPKSL